MHLHVSDFSPCRENHVLALQTVAGAEHGLLHVSRSVQGRDNMHFD